jgi:hypothetical protein
MLGGIAGSVLGGGGSLGPMAPSVQGGFIGNSGGLASQFPLGAVGQIGDINKDIVDKLKLDNSFGLAGAVAANPFGGLVQGGTQMGNAGGMGMFSDPMTIKKLF